MNSEAGQLTSPKTFNILCNGRTRLYIHTLITADSKLFRDWQDLKNQSIEAIPVPQINLHMRTLVQQKLGGAQ
jgi:hypothetical protein